jgi:hypothetical protein
MNPAPHDLLNRMNKTETIYLIEARTGCTCCQSQNHYRGPYKTREDAEKRIQFYRTSQGEKAYWPLASQYARRGAYSVTEWTCETLPDGRKIIGGDTVVEPTEFNFIQVNEDGSVLNNEVECFSAMDY